MQTYIVVFGRPQQSVWSATSSKIADRPSRMRIGLKPLRGSRKDDRSGKTERLAWTYSYSLVKNVGLSDFFARAAPYGPTAILPSTGGCEVPGTTTGACTC